MSDGPFGRGSREGRPRSRARPSTSPPRSSPRFLCIELDPSARREFVDAVRRARALFRSRSRRCVRIVGIIELRHLCHRPWLCRRPLACHRLPSCPLACCRRIWPSRPSCPCRPSCRRNLSLSLSQRPGSRSGDAVIHAEHHGRSRRASRWRGCPSRRRPSRPDRPWLVFDQARCALGLADHAHVGCSV